MAKQISPVTIWNNGTLKTAEFLDAYAIHVKLYTNAKFYWELLEKKQDADGNDVPGESVASGNIPMDEATYQTWDSDDIAFDYVAQELNLTII